MKKREKQSLTVTDDCPVVSGVIYSSRFDYSLLLIYLSGKCSCLSIAIGLGWLQNRVTQYNFLKCEGISDVKCTFSSEFHRPFFSIVVVVCFSRYGRFVSIVSIVSFWSFRLFRCGRFGRFGSFACFVSVVSFRCFGF